MSAKESNVGDIFATVGDRHFASVLLQGKKGNDFIVRTFGVKLYLRVLVGNAKRFNGRLTYITGLAVKRFVFAKAFRPKLAISVCKVFQVVRIGHHNADIHTTAHTFKLQHGAHKRGVFIHRRRFAQMIHIRCARQKTFDIDTANGSG